MRTFVKHGFIAVAVATMALACGNDRPPQGPTSDPKPQRAFSDPAVQAPSDPIANDHHAPQKPINDPKPQQPTLGQPSVQSPMNDPEPQKSTFGTGGSTAENRVLAKTEKPLSDAEVLGVAEAANDGEVQMAEVAIKKATAAEVKQFASMMKNHHSASMQKGKTVATKTKLSPSESEVSTFLKTDTANTLKDLRDKEGKPFDRAYMESQVKAHRNVLSAIDNRLTPSAKNGEVKSLLTELRRTVADHLVKAEDIQKRLDSMASTSSPEGGSTTVGIGTPEPREKPTHPAGKHETQSTKARTGQ
jgi:putative membrane protein